MRELLIVGIDPGATTAYAVFDINGKFMLASSSKEFDLNTVVRQVIAIGDPVIIGTDRMKSPEYVLKLATKLGCRIYNPSYDLKVGEKIAATRSLKLRNDHERDAAASAIYAFRDCRALLEKADKFLERESKHHLAGEVKRLVLLDEISIRAAIELAEYEDETPAQAEHHEKVIINDELVFLRSELRKYIKANRQLKLSSQLLELQKEKALKGMATVEKSAKSGKFDQRLKQLLSFRETRIARMQSQLDSAKKENERLGRELEKVEMLVLVEKAIIAKPGAPIATEYLFVGDLQNASRERLQKLKPKAILHYGPVPPGLKNAFIFINASQLKLEEHDHFVAADKKELDELVKKSDLLARIISSYRSERHTS